MPPALSEFVRRHPVAATAAALLAAALLTKSLSRFYLVLRRALVHTRDPPDVLTDQGRPPPLDLSSLAAPAPEAGEDSARALAHLRRELSLALLAGGGSGGGGGGAAALGSPSLDDVGLPLEPGTPGGGPAVEGVLPFLKLIARLGGALSLVQTLDLQRVMVPRTLERGETLMAAGADAADGLYLILRGRLGVFAGGEGGGVASGGTGVRRVPSAASQGSLPEAASPRAGEGSGEGGQLCAFEAGASLGENALLAGVLPAAGGSSSGGGIGSGGAAAQPAPPAAAWLPSSDATRPVTVRAL